MKRIGIVGACTVWMLGCGSAPPDPDPASESDGGEEGAVHAQAFGGGGGGARVGNTWGALRDPMAPEIAEAVVAPPAVAEPTTGENVRREVRSVGHVASPVEFVATQPCAGVSGVWRGRVYSDRHGAYYDFTLDVARQGSTGLRGTIVAQFWDGDESRVEPPSACTNQEQHVTVSETAAGRTDEDGTMHFGGTRWRVTQHTCGEHVTDYSPDRFDVQLAMGANRADAILKDDAVWTDGLPIALTRVSCD